MMCTRGFRFFITAILSYTLCAPAIAQTQQDARTNISQEAHQTHKQIIFDYFSNLLEYQTPDDLNLYEAALLTDHRAEKKDENTLTTSEIKFVTEALIMSVMGWAAAQIVYVGAQITASTVPRHVPAAFTPKEQILLRQPASFWMYASSDIRGQMPHIDALLEKVDYMIVKEQVIIDYPPIHQAHVLAGDMPVLQSKRAVLEFDQFHRLIRKAITLPPDHGLRFMHVMLDTKQMRDALSQTNTVFEKTATRYMRNMGLEVFLTPTLKNQYATFFRANRRWIKYGTNTTMISIALVYYLFHTQHETRLSFLNPQNFFMFFEILRNHLLAGDFLQLNAHLDEQPYLTSLLANYLQFIPTEISAYKRLTTDLNH